MQKLIHLNSIWGELVSSDVSHQVSFYLLWLFFIHAASSFFLLFFQGNLHNIFSNLKETLWFEKLMEKLTGVHSWLTSRYLEMVHVHKSKCGCAVINLFLHLRKFDIQAGLISLLPLPDSESCFSNTVLNHTANFWPFNTEDSSKHVLSLAGVRVCISFFLFFKEAYYRLHFVWEMILLPSVKSVFFTFFP